MRSSKCKKRIVRTRMDDEAVATVAGGRALLDKAKEIATNAKAGTPLSTFGIR